MLNCLKKQWESEKSAYGEGGSLNRFLGAP
jgi:hypothetical protein